MARSPGKRNGSRATTRGRAVGKAGTGKARGAGRRRGAPRRRRSFIGRLFYGMVVLGLWAAIAVVGLVAYHATQLPPIDRLTVPQRPPNVAILANDGSLIANPRRDRGAQYQDGRRSRPSATSLHRHRGSALLRPFRHRSDRYFPRIDHQRHDRRHRAGRLDDYPATGQETCSSPRSVPPRARSRRRSSPSGWSDTTARTNCSSSI